MNICQKCFDDMHMVRTEEGIKFVCDSHCGYEDTNWVVINPFWLKEFKTERMRAESAECRESQLKQALEYVIHRCSGSPAYTDGAYACYYANRALRNVYGDVSNSNVESGQVEKKLFDIRRIAKDADMDEIVMIIDRDLGFQMGYHRIDLPCVGQLPKYNGVTG